MSPGFNSVVPMREELLVSPKVLVPLMYQFCLYLGPAAGSNTPVGWITTGISIAVEWSCRDGVPYSFDRLYAHETSSAASFSNAISIIAKLPMPTLPPGGVLVVRGLEGSSTPDTGFLIL
jgi:hypothetical protein